MGAVGLGEVVHRGARSRGALGALPLSSDAHGGPRRYHGHPAVCAPAARGRCQTAAQSCFDPEYLCHACWTTVTPSGLYAPGAIFGWP
ncbi:hypothetical protein GCM10010406_54010 [Streptomyces thermolineatus]|uniref:Uncharacterized protein n=1 Tax=Streptomyces thermolineatus TaxID=44033 RepID=A0ABP6AC13_9ACTN